MNQSFDRALTIDPNKKILGQEKTVKEFVVLARSQFWAEIYNRGVVEFNEYQAASSDSASNAAMKKAITTFEVSARIKPDEAQSYTMLSRCNHLAGNTDKSEDYILKAVALSPDDATVNVTAGQIFMQKQDFEAALPYVKKAVELEPSNTKSIRNLAQIYYDTGQLEESIQTYEIAIDKETDREVKADLYFNLGILYNRVGLFESAEKWRKAEKFYRELIAIDPDNPDHYRGMSRVLLQQGEPDESLRYLEKAKRLGG